MKKSVLLVLFLVATTAFAQLNIETARNLFYSYRLGSYSYHENFIGHAKYGAPYILTSDGGAAFMGTSGDENGTFALVGKLNKDSSEAWTYTIRNTKDELEGMSIVETSGGNFLVFYLSYDYTKYNGGAQFGACFSADGKLIWDKLLGQYNTVNNPIIAYIRATSDNEVELRGHIVTQKAEEGKDPIYRFWYARLSLDGIMNERIGDVINWSDQTWQDKFKPE